MKNYELLKNYYSNEFKDIFLYRELENFDYKKIPLIIEQFKEQDDIDLSNVNWIYATMEYYYLIGIQNDNIIGLTSDAELETITDDFALLPFKLMIYRHVGFSIEDSREGWDQEYLNELQDYALWCKEKGIIVQEEDLKWIY